MAEFSGFPKKFQKFFSADLVDYAYNHYRRMAPVHRWLLKVDGM